MTSNPRRIIDFLIWDKDNSKFLIQKRSEDRQLFPGRWEIPGGHLEGNESIEECIKRELFEETSMSLVRNHGKVHQFIWPDSDGVVNEVYIIEASGKFQPEADKISEHRWIDGRDVSLLLHEDEQSNGLYEAFILASLRVKNINAKLFSDPVIKDDIEKYIVLAESAGKMADMARVIALNYFRSDFSIEEKDDKSPVTLADKEIERTLRAYIENHHPDHGIIGEEFGKSNSDAEYVWVIDPIDGTKAFATGKPLFGTIIGLAHHGRPVVGIIDQAFTEERWVGVKGVGSKHNGIPIKVAPPRDIGEARFYTAAPEMFHGELFSNFERLRQSTKWTLYGCDCYAYGLLAMGQIDLVIEQYLGLHDFIGLVPVIEGANGYVSDWNGNDITLETKGQIVASSCKELAMKAVSLLNFQKDVSPT